MQIFRTAISLGLFLFLTACVNVTESEPNAPPTPTDEGAVVESEVDQTSTSTSISARPTTSPTASPSKTSTPTPTPTASATLDPTSTPVPPTPTDEPELVSLADTAGNSVNVRSGPGTDYEVLDTLKPGEVAPVTGRNDDESWWQIGLAATEENEGGGPYTGWVYADIVAFSGNRDEVSVATAPPPPTPTRFVESEQVAQEATPASGDSGESGEDEPVTPEDLAEQLRCGKDFCVTYQAMVPIWENGGCIGNHSIYVTVLEGPPPGRPLDGVVIGDTFGNIEVASGSKGPGQAEVTLWMNSMSLLAKRHIDGREYTSEESFSFTSHDELIPAEVLAANGYCDGRVETCRQAQQQNQVCRGHYSYRVTFHKFD